MHDEYIWHSEVVKLIYTLQLVLWTLFKDIKKIKSDKDGSCYTADPWTTEELEA